jgi:hydrogenase expression/formation protein HypE
VANEGIFVTIVAAAIAEDVLALMKNHEKSPRAACIGEFTNEHPKKVVMHSIIGGKRMVTPLLGEQLPRIC